jgi:hypothetical protein
MEQEKWDTIRADYRERKRIEKLEGIKKESELLENIFQRLEVVDYDRLRTKNKLPKELDFVVLTEENGEFYFESKQWGVKLAKFKDIFKYEELAIKRNRYYQTLEEEEYDDETRGQKKEEFMDNQDFESVAQAESEQLAEWHQLLNDDDWVEVMDGYWVEGDIVRANKFDYYKAALPIDVAVAVVNKRIKDLEIAKNQTPDDLIIKH